MILPVRKRINFRGLVSSVYFVLSLLESACVKKGKAILEKFTILIVGHGKLAEEV